MEPGESKIAHNNAFTVPWRAEGATVAPPGAVPDYAAREEDIAAFRRDGAVLLKGAFADWAGRLAAGLERNLAEPEAYAFPCESTAAGEAGRFFDSYCNWQRIPEYLDYVTSSCAAAMAGRFMGASRAQFFHEHAFAKEPGTQRATPWHQDLPYYCVDGTHTVSIYVALDPTPAEVAVRFVAGSHRWGKLFQPRVFLDGAAFNTEDAGLEPVPDIDGRPQDYEILAWALEPGDAILFDFRTLHGTGDAPVAQRRRAVSTRWLGDDVTYCERPGETSPPYPDIGLKPGDPLREDWFPVLWREG
jgi:ectoine hydroxylase-related dioxygenase (phytanoyl-CoA dioxygenase family)